MPVAIASVKLGSVVKMIIQTEDITGAAADADAVPAVRVYKPDGVVGNPPAYYASASGNATQLDGQTGTYRWNFTMADEAGCWCVRVAATVDGITSVDVASFWVSTKDIDDVYGAVGSIATDQYFVVGSAVYRCNSDTLYFDAWLLKNGQPVASPTEVTAYLYEFDESSPTLKATLTSNSADARHAFHIKETSLSLTSRMLHLVYIELVSGGETYKGNTGMGVI